MKTCDKQNFGSSGGDEVEWRKGKEHSSFSQINLTLCSLSHWGMSYLGDLRFAYGHTLLILVKWSKSKIDVVQEQNTI